MPVAMRKKQTIQKDTFDRTQLAGWDKQFIWHPFTQMSDWEKDEILIIESGKGRYLKDIDGKRYLDGVSSLWCNVHGHRVKELDQAIKQQLGKVSHTTFLGLSNVPAVLLAKKLIEITPNELSRVFYSDSGSESVEIALKIAYQYWQQKGEKSRTKFLRLTNAYHGDTLGSVSVGGIDLFHEIYGPLLFKSIPVKAPYRYRDEVFLRHCEQKRVSSPKSFVGDPKNNRFPPKDCGNDRENGYLDFCIEDLENAILKYKNETCALIMEPLVQGAAGMLLQPAGYLEAVRKLTKKHNILLIVDEVATGFGRTGKMFACDHEMISPDIMCVAKGLTGGYLPLAATLTTETIYKAFLGKHEERKTFFHGHTYTANPLACAAALANLELFEKDRVIANLQPKIKFLREGLEKFRSLNHVGDIRQCGFMVGIELVKDKQNKTPYDIKEKIGIHVIKRVRATGVILRPLGNVIILMPPLGITIPELRKLLRVAYQSIRFVTD